jgi:hypothetical protein
MEWKGKNETSYNSLARVPLVNRFLFGVNFSINEINYSIDLVGTYSIRKRKVVSLGENKEIYKITIEDLSPDITYLGVVDSSLDGTGYLIYPLIKSSGLLFSKISKKIIVNKNRQKIEFLVDSFGKYLG